MQCRGFNPRRGTQHVEKRVTPCILLGGIQQLRGQEEGEGGHPKVHACPLRGGGPLNVHVDKNLAISDFRKYFIPLFTVMGGKSEIKLHYIRLSGT